MSGHLDAIAEYWDLVARKYLGLFRDELHEKPFDVALLKSFAASLSKGADVCDVGCGPCGHVTRLLADQGLHVRGIDLSPKCVALARAEQPSLSFDVMDMGGMTFGDGSFDALIAYYALHYQPSRTFSHVFREFYRVLRPGGRLLLVSKEGHEEGMIDDPLGTGRQVFWCALPAGELTALLSQAGFEILNCTTRQPLPTEIPVPRIYIQAECPTSLA